MKGKMNEQELEFILQEGEGLKIEFKEAFDKSLAKEICAFANSKGGRIFIGISDDGKIKGIKITNGLRSQIQDIARKCDPPLNVKLSFVVFEEKKIMVIDVSEGKDKPYKCSGGFYLRQGANSQKLNVSEIREFFNQEGKILFDEMINKKFSLKKGFGKEKFNLFLEKAGLSKVLPLKNLLRNIGVVQFDN